MKSGKRSAREREGNDGAQLGRRDVQQRRGLVIEQRANALVARGQARLLVGRSDEALSDFKAALNENPNHMRALFGRGVARQRLGDTAGASDRDEALRKLPGAGREFLPAMLG